MLVEIQNSNKNVSAPRLPSADEALPFSTMSDVRYLRGRIMPAVQNKLINFLDLSEDREHRYNKAWIDPLSPEIQKIKRLNKSEMRAVRFDGKPITTISTQIYGTTSLWWVLLLINGYAHPEEIQRGAVLLVPNISDITKIISVEAVSRRGTIVEA